MGQRDRYISSLFHVDVFVSMTYANCLQGDCNCLPLESVDVLYSTAIFTLSLPIFATTIVPLVAENVAVPSVAVAEPRAAPSTAKKSTRSLVSRPERVMKPPADCITTPRVFAVLMFVPISDVGSQ